MHVRSRESTVDGIDFSRGTIRERFFPGAWAFGEDVLRELSDDQRPTFYVYYADSAELKLARSVQPRFINVEYVERLIDAGKPE